MISFLFISMVFFAHLNMTIQQSEILSLSFLICKRGTAYMLQGHCEIKLKIYGLHILAG